VLCDVYPLRSRGLKLPPEEVRRSGRRGWLEMAKRDDGAPVQIAVLRSERGGLAGQLHSACVTRITREGLMVTGWEMPARHRQAWWCVPVVE
jgi:hypothetical protein